MSNSAINIGKSAARSQEILQCPGTGSGHLAVCHVGVLVHYQDNIPGPPSWLIGPHCWILASTFSTLRYYYNYIN